MNHKFLIVLAALMALCGPVQAQMTDEQIIEYVQPVSYTHLRAHETG